ncbi:MAG: glycosyltransferase family 4 protein [Fimbriimonadaceae bacterium]
MRALFVNRPDAHTSYGGDTAQMEHTAEALRALGVEVVVSVGAPSYEQIERADIVHLVNLQTPAFTHAQLLRAKQAGKKVAVSTIWWDFAADDVFQTSRKWGALRELFGTDTVRPILERRMRKVLFESRALHRAILRGADLLLPNSESEAAHLRALTPFETRVHVVPNGVATGALEDNAAADQLLSSLSLGGGQGEGPINKSPFILIAARVEPVKNQLAYVRAVRPLPVVCAGAITQPYGRDCESAGALLLGRQDPAVVRALYRRAALHALPSLRETPGLASLEAAAAGCRVLSTEVGSARDYFGDMAWYCDPHSARSMLRATEGALARPPAPGLAEHVKQNFTWPIAAQETLRGYESVL